MRGKQLRFRVKDDSQPLPTWVVGLAVGLLATILGSFFSHVQEGPRRAALSALGWVTPMTFTGILNNILGIVICVFIAWVAYHSVRNVKFNNSSRH